jgi:hypothetical protein
MIIPISLLLASMAAAQTADKGYVVRVDSNSVWLDLTAADGAVPGRAFEIYTEGEELKHPVTGASLGRVQTEVAEGEIKDVADKFSTGRITALKGGVQSGQRARFTAAAPTPPAAAAASRPGEPESRAPKLMGAAVRYEISAMAIGDYERVNRPEIVLASENTIRLYAYPMTSAKPLAELTIPGTGLRILGLESGDLDGDGGDELFVSVFDEAFSRFETRVYSIQNGKWLKVAELPFLTRGYQDGTGKRVLATQQITDDQFPFAFGAIYPLAYQDGKYVQGRPRVNIPRVDWLFEFTTAQIGDGAPAALYLTTTHHLRVQFGKEWWVTPDDDYGQTPLRLRWKDKVLEFNPPILASYGPSGFDAAYAVRNMAALGGLASPFGVFNHAELVAKKWNGLGLETTWKADLSGCAQGLALVDADGHKEIAVAVRGAAGQSSVWTFAP